MRRITLVSPTSLYSIINKINPQIKIQVGKLHTNKFLQMGKLRNSKFAQKLVLLNNKRQQINIATYRYQFILTILSTQFYT